MDGLQQKIVQKRDITVMMILGIGLSSLMIYSGMGPMRMSIIFRSTITQMTTIKVIMVLMLKNFSRELTTSIGSLGKIGLKSHVLKLQPSCMNKCLVQMGLRAKKS